MELTDEELIERAKAGDETAFGFLVDKYKGAVHALAYRKLRDYHDAEDITQEVFLRAYQKLSTLKDGRNFAGWLYVITANCCGMHWRKRRKKVGATVRLEDVTDEQWGTLSVAKYTDLERRQLVQDAIATLSECDRTAITLHYMGGMSCKEIARFLGTSAGAIKYRLYSARQHLKEELVKMMKTEFAENKLDAGFTVNLMEMLRSLKPVAPSKPTPNITRTIPLSIATAITIITIGAGLLGGIMPHFEMWWQFEQGVSDSEKHIQVALVYAPTGTSDALEGQLENQRMILAMDNAQHPLSETLTAPEITGANTPAMKTKKEGMPAVTSIAEEARGNITVSGKVVKEGMPVPNAEIYLYDQQMKKVDRIVVADADGSFSFDIPKLTGADWSRPNIIAVSKQYSLGWLKLTEKVIANSVTIQLYDATTITGTITDEAGHPIPGAEARLYWVSGPSGQPVDGNLMFDSMVSAFGAKADEKGDFVLRNLPKDARASLYIVGQGYAGEVKFSINSGTQGMLFKLKREGRIEGQIIFGDTGEPAKKIGACIQGVGRTVGYFETRTDEDGFYTFTNLYPGNYNVFIQELPDLTAVAREHISIAEGRTVKGMDMQLVEGGFITGRATNEDTREPIPHHGISLHDTARPRSQGKPHSTRTDEKGFYRLRAAPGRAMVYTSPPKGYDQSVKQISKYANVVEGEETTVDFQFKPLEGIELKGTVVSFDGEPVAGAEIIDRDRWLHKYATSDKDGKFTITGLRVGQKLSLKAAQKKMKLKGYVDIEVQPGAELDILLESYETISVQGRVVNEQGEAIPSVNIEFLKWDEEAGHGTSSVATVTDGSGKFEINELIIGDEYEISAKAEGYGPAGTGMFTAQSNMPPLEDIVLSKAGRFLEGKVTDTEGNPVAGARVTINWGSPSGFRETMTDAEGNYRLDNLSSVVETIGISHRDYGYSNFKYILTNQTQNFVLIRADRSLAGKVIDKDGNPIQNAFVIASSHGDVSGHDVPSGHVDVGYETNALGKFRLEGIAHERETISVSHREHGFKKFEDVETNQDDVVFVLKKESSEPPQPPTEEELARREYWKRAEERSKNLDGKLAPELDVAQWLNCEPLTRIPANLATKLKGKVVVLYFWTSRRTRCIEAMRLMDALQKEYGDKGVVVIGIHESTADVDKLKKLLEEKSIKFKIAVDKESSEIGAKGETFDKYGVWHSSKFIVIDKKGIVHTDVRDDNIEGKIKELLYK